MARSGQGHLWRSTAIGIALTLMSPMTAPADYPGELWSVDLVTVEGSSGTGAANAIGTGLRRANDTYFFGSDRSTRMVAKLRGPGVMDLKIIDQQSGAVVAEQSNIGFGVGGDVSRAVTNAALQWMDGLSCADGCALAVSGTAPAPQVQVAAAPAQPAPESEPQAQPEPQEADETPAEVVVEEEAQTVVAAAPAPSAPDIETAAVKPSAPAAREDAPAITSVQEERPAAPKGLDADEVLAAITAAQPSQPSLAAPAIAAPAKPDAAPARPTAKPTTEPARGASPKPVDRPAATSTPAPTAGATDQTPTIAEAQPAAQPAAPATPTAPSQTAEATEGDNAVTPPNEEGTPKIATAPDEPAEVPSAAEIAEALTAATPEEEAPSSAGALQEVAPGINLPQPTATAPTLAGTTETPAAPAAPAPVEPEIKLVNPGEPTELPQPEDTALAPREPEETATVPTIATPIPRAPETGSDGQSDGDGEQLALVNPRAPVDPVTPAATTADGGASAPADPEVTAKPEEDEDSGTKVETRIAAVDPTAAGPTLANARWVGFTPAVYTGGDNRAGAWISGPFDRKERTGWITDTATGATTRVTFIWREATSGGRTAVLSREAAKALGLGQGDVANVAVYLPR